MTTTSKYTLELNQSEMDILKMALQNHHRKQGDWVNERRVFLNEEKSKGNQSAYDDAVKFRDATGRLMNDLNPR